MELKQFSGLANKTTQESLPDGALVEALNVDIDDAGKLRRRRGSKLASTGGFHSLYAESDDIGYVVRNGDLCRFTASMEMTVIRAGVGDAKLSYQRVGDRVYAKSRTHALSFTDSDVAQDWGIPLVPVFLLNPGNVDSSVSQCQVAVVYRRDSDGLEGGSLAAMDTNLSGNSITVSHIPNLAGHTASIYVSTPGGETLYLAADGVIDSATIYVDGLTNGIQCRTDNMTPPTGSGPLAYLLGRILIADGNVLWATNPYQYELVDLIAGYKMLESEITFIGAVVDGLFIGTQTGVFFMAGPFESAQLTRVSTRAAPKQTPSQIDMANVLTGEQQGVGVLFLTDGGVCVGQPGGQVTNLTNKIFEFPKASEVTVMARQQDGLNQFVGVATHPSTPSGSARFGDYVDAEIVRFKGV